MPDAPLITLEPIDYDPWAQPPQKPLITLEPIPHDPFAEGNSK